MKVKMILPTLTEAGSPFWRPIKYSLFPPLGLATLAGYFSDSDDISIVDEHVEILTTNDSPDLVIVQARLLGNMRPLLEAILMGIHKSMSEPIMDFIRIENNEQIKSA